MKKSKEQKFQSIKYNQIDILFQDEIKQVYLSKKKDNNQKVIIKQINLSKLDENIRKKLKKEGVMMLKLNHPNIIKWYEFIIEKNKEIIIMEYAEGGDLSKKIQKHKNKNEPFKENQIIDWFIEICEGIKYIFENQILNINLKTNNIFLTKDNKIKIGDFNTSTILNFETEGQINIETLSYLSPENMIEQSYDYKSNIWNLGIILYELTQLKHPFFDDSISVGIRMKNIKEGKYFDFLNNKYSEQLLHLIKNLLKVNPNERLNINEIIEECYIIKIKNDSVAQRE